MMDKEKILKIITDFYLDSGDFNGISANEVLEKTAMEESKLKDTLANIVAAGDISLNFGDSHPNPFIKAFEAEKIEVQLEKLKSKSLKDDLFCIYPLNKVLSSNPEVSKHSNEAFTQRLILGEPQLKFYSFDLSVLEFYRNDPRYYYQNDDITGNIGVHSEFFETTEMRESDQVLVEHFGFSYDEKMNRAVTVPLIYLSRLSAEHQQIWQSKILSGDYLPHPDFYNITMGHWPEKIPIFDAFIEELHHINEMCLLTGKPKLFKQTFKDDKPKEFCFLIRPTLKQFNEFTLLLDKMISENINKDFFRGDIQLEEETITSEGKIILKEKGTLKLFEEWLEKYYKVKDRAPINEMLTTLRKIRKFRQKPAHAINEDEFKQKYFGDQRDLIVDAYSSIRLIRLIFANHPNVKGYQIPQQLKEGKIWTY